MDKVTSAPLTSHEALSIGIQVAERLEAPPKHPILPRDIKSANIFVTERGQAKILDFGLAHIREAVDEDTETETAPTCETEPGKVMGTLGYMAPEQVLGESVGPAADIYALGVVLFEMLTQELPLRGTHSTQVMLERLQHDGGVGITGRFAFNQGGISLANASGILALTVNKDRFGVPRVAEEFTSRGVTNA